jgi:hypothetical protein
MNHVTAVRGFLRPILAGLIIGVFGLGGCIRPKDALFGEGTIKPVGEEEGRCEVRPPFEPNFEPELEWHWSGSTVMPTHNQVMMTPVVVDVNGDGVPDVVFNSFAGGEYSFNGVLRAISGDDGHDLWTVTDPTLQVRGAASLAAGDIDHDGLVELCTVPESGSGVICFENDGTFKFRVSGPALNWGGPSFADLNGDGNVEILAGNYVYSNTGAVLWVGADGLGGVLHAGTGPISFAADLDQDGLLEVINDRAIYRHDGSFKCVNTSINHGLAGVGNFDADPYGEVVIVSQGSVFLMDDDCRLLWRASIPGGGQGGAPNIADFDGDGRPEVGVAGASRYVVLETDGSIRWTSATQDLSSNRTGSSTFDFEGDGRAEVIYGDEVRLRIYDGATGVIRFEVPHSSGTTYENPVIVDVDGDDNAEIVMPSNNYHIPTVTGIRVFRDRRDGWVNTRPIWNQHAYSVTNVNDDGTIPAHPATNWLSPGPNTFRSNSQGSGSTSPFAAADLIVGEVMSACDRATETLHLQARVVNQGDAATSAGLQVAFYRGNPTAGGSLLGVATLDEVLPAGASAVVDLPLLPAPGGTAEIWAVADNDGAGNGRELECREDNNAGSAEVDLTCRSNIPPVALCRDVVVSADAACLGQASIDAGSYDPDRQPGTFTLTQSPPGPFVLGSHAVTLTVSDGLESASCAATVTVIDDTPPALTCPSDQRLECVAGGASASFSPQANDNCGPLTLACEPASGTSFPLGSNVVTCQATDGAGRQTSCQFVVTVEDTQPPTTGGDQGLVLWPPNHKYHSITLADCAGAAEDVCTGSLPTAEYGRITYVTSDETEDDNGNGDGRSCDDILLVGPTEVAVRAEREGTSDGRVYRLHYELRDLAGHVTPGSCTVSVPHDQSGRVAIDSGAVFCVGSGCPSGTGGSPLCAGN